MKAIREGSTKRVLSMLEGLADSEDAAEKDKYAAFWKDFGVVLKEGVGEDHANRERLAKLLRFASTHDATAAACRFADYVGRMKEGQEAIYYITADTLAAAKNSPQLEIFRKKGIEVLLLIDRVDEWMLTTCTSSTAQPLQSVAKGAVDLGKLQDEAEKKQAEEAATAFKPMLERLKDALKDRAKDVRVTTRLVDSPACLVVEEGDMSGHLARLLKQAGQGAPTSQPILEVNAEHRAGQAARIERALRRPGPHPVRPGAAGRRRSARRPGRLRAARQRLAAGLIATRSATSRCAASQAGLPSGGSAIASSCSRSRVRLLGPVRRAREPREVDREGRVAPAPRDPGAVVQHAQRAQRLDQAQLAPVEVHERLVAVEHVEQLARHRGAVAREQHPQVLHRRAGDGVVEVDEVRAGVGPQDVARMAVAVQAQRRGAAALSKASRHGGERLRRRGRASARRRRR